MHFFGTRSQSLFKRVRSTTKIVRTKVGNGLVRVEKPLRSRPLLSFFGLIALLFLFIVAMSFFNKPEPEAAQAGRPAIAVQTVSVGQAPRIRVNGQVEKSGVITIVAQAPGVIRSINVEPGQDIRSGMPVVSMASNYTGGNIPALQASIAQKQYENTESTQNQQRELIARQRDAAEKQETSAEELREISRNSLSGSRDLLKLNEDILMNLETVLKTSTDSAELAQTQQLRAQVFSGVVQLRQQIAQTEYQSSDDKAPADLADLQRQITLKQLELQEKSLELNLEVSKLQAQIARVQASSMYPSAPFNARVERIHVKKGEFVQPGTPLVTIDCDTLATQVIAKVPASVARQISMIEPSIVLIGQETFQITPDYISQEATDVRMYSVQFTLPQEATDWLANESFVTVELPLGMADTTAAVPFVPLDAIHQNELSSRLYVIEDNKAVARTVKLGSVQGRFVSVESGLNPGDVVIVNRNVVADDPVTVETE